MTTIAVDGTKTTIDASINKPDGEGGEENLLPFVLRSERVKFPMQNATRDQAKGRHSMLRQSSAWQSAIAEGLDMSLVELSLAKTPWERLVEHDEALEFAEHLRRAGATKLYEAV